MHRAETALSVTRDLGFGAGVAGEPDEAKVSRPVRRGAVGKGASSWTGHLVSRLPNEVDKDDWQANERALGEGTRLLSAYTLSTTNETVWIITEWDRSATTILRPDEY